MKYFLTFKVTQMFFYVCLTRNYLEASRNQWQFHPLPTRLLLHQPPQTSNTLRSSSDALLRTAEIISRSNTPESYFLTSQALLPALFGKKKTLVYLSFRHTLASGPARWGSVELVLKCCWLNPFFSRKKACRRRHSQCWALGLGAVRCWNVSYCPYCHEMELQFAD